MFVSPLNLISTPVAVLNSLGLNLRVGLSSEDAMVGRTPSEPYEAYLSIYSPEGPLLERMHLGQISPSRRRFFDVSSLTRNLVPELDHLTVVHRVPSRLLSSATNVEDQLNMSSIPDYSLFRSLVEYSFPQGGNGSVIYETPPGLNGGASVGKSSNTFTFTSKMVLSESVNTYAILIHYSVDPSYANIANFNFALYSLSGEQVVSDSVAIGPFSVKVLDIGRTIPEHVVKSMKDPQDGLAAFSFVGYSDDASILVVIMNASSSLGAVALEHTHPYQTYFLASDPTYQRKAKADAQKTIKAILATEVGA